MSRPGIEALFDERSQMLGRRDGSTASRHVMRVRVDDDVIGLSRGVAHRPEDALFVARVDAVGDRLGSPGGNEASAEADRGGSGESGTLPPSRFRRCPERRHLRRPRVPSGSSCATRSSPGRPFMSGRASPARDIGVNDVASPISAILPCRSRSTSPAAGLAGGHARARVHDVERVEQRFGLDHALDAVVGGVVVGVIEEIEAHPLQVVRQLRAGRAPSCRRSPTCG